MSGKNAAIDRRVSKAWVLALLERGVVAEIAAGGIPAADPDPVAAFGQHLKRLRPVVLVEAAVPYAEHLVAEILVERGFAAKAWPVVDVTSGNLLPSLPHGDDDILLLSFYEDAGIANPVELRNKLEKTSHAVLIGCQRRDDLPDTYRRLVDLTLTLPVPDAEQFAAVFARLFGAPLAPAGAAAAGEPAGEAERWRDFVLFTDLQQPLRLGYEPAAAAAYIEQRVRERQRRVAPQRVPRLRELHGLGAARDIAQDLIHDIGLALAGRIPWREVDRGMLMVGPPGTGKTTLARSIARESGLHFVSATPANWQGANLGPHLANIRASFDEARRARTAILFIDEIDGIGNREKLTASGRSYQTKVINALLEELDGFSRQDGVVVIGATNDETNVDPALRRAGRLDQVVRVPYPNVAALTEIYRFHLAPAGAEGRLHPDVDAAALAGLSFGLTGADVEFFVRGAARRARRRGDRIGQADLVDEIMKRPRVPGAAGGRIDPQTLRRLAVHEAGHAVAMLATPGREADIGYVSIAPRSDGRVGFIASMPDERVCATRADELSEIAVCLAGRAAEELVFGADAVSDLAADYGPASDLARATARARALAGTTGLGASGSVLWWSALPEALRGPLDAEVSAILDGCYADARRLLGARRAGFDRLAAHLEEHQEIAGAALRRLF